MKIVVLDGYTTNPGDLSWRPLERLGTLQIYDQSPVGDDAAIIERIGEAEAVFTNKTPITRAVLERCPKLGFVGVLATGYNVVDTKAARELNIPVCNVPGYSTASVAQFAIALLLEICMHVAHHAEAVRAGRWKEAKGFCFWDYPLIELSGKTMGIIGLGNIGRATAKIAGAMGMAVLATGSRETPEGRAVAEYVGFDELLARADVVVLHCPLNEQTRNMIDAAAIAKMKDGVILINNSRGPLIVERDLVAALKSGKIYAAGLDVVAREPIADDNELLTLDNCFITPHISWAPRESRARLIDAVANNLAAFAAGAPINVVN